MLKSTHSKTTVFIYFIFFLFYNIDNHNVWSSPFLTKTDCNSQLYRYRNSCLETDKTLIYSIQFFIKDDLTISPNYVQMYIYFHNNCVTLFTFYVYSSTCYKKDEKINNKLILIILRVMEEAIIAEKMHNTLTWDMYIFVLPTRKFYCLNIAHS